MQKFLVLVVFLGLFSFPLMAQDSPKAEVFGGYQYLRLNDVLGTGVDVNANGWEASVTGNVNQWFGVTGDFGGVYKSVTGADAHIYTYTGGPVINLNHSGVVNPFVHALLGGARFGGSVSGEGSGGTNGFTMMYGGGVDVKVSKLFALRGQVDWEYFRFSGVNFNKNVRVSTGIVLRF